jgi:hypothetical protein
VTSEVDLTAEADLTADSELAAATLPQEDGGADETGPPECPNCGTPRAGPYCFNCGQKALPLRPTLKYFVREVTHELTNLDGKIFRSLRLLIASPGFLTREIFAGRRASYVAPLRLYLAASVLAFAIGSFGGFDEPVLTYTAEPGDSALEIEQGQASTAAAEDLLVSAFDVWLPRAMFVLVPLFAALVMLFRRGSGYTYPQHLYFALHVHAAAFLANAVDATFEAIPALAFAAPVVDKAMELYIVAYFFIAFRRVYETTLMGTVGRGLAIGVLYVAVLVSVFVAIAAPTVWPLFFGDSS